MTRRRKKRATVLDFRRYQERRARMQATCGHSLVWQGKCSYCGAAVPQRYDQLPMFDEPA